MTTLSRLGFAAATVLTLCFGIGSASAFVAAPALTGISVDSLATPVAMCGRTCRSGGRYIPGPPEVCYQRGLEYCGSSRGGPGPGVGVVIPGTGVGVGVGPGGVGIGVGPGRRDCRTITTRRPDGSVTTVRRCD
jgi:hypothetical protein